MADPQTDRPTGVAGDASLIGASGEKAPKTSWFKLTVDSKPWWAIIVAAALGAFGSEAIKNSPAIYSWGRSFFPIETSQFLYVSSKETKGPVKGVIVQIFGPGELALPLNSAGDTKIQTSARGLADAQIHVRPGPGYVAVFKYNNLVKTLPFEVKGDAQLQVEFSPTDWASEDERSVVPVNPNPPVGDAAGDLPPWMKFAYAELGQTEFQGTESNQRILEYLRSTNLPNSAISDETDWSSAFVNWVVRQVGYSGTNSAVNRSWLTWGKPIYPIQPGCVAVFWRISPTDPTGHTGFVVGETDTTITIIGGNQHNSVSIVSVPKARFLGCRWPA
ncbi:TIGR02594 family protein [Rhizobium ruizarguesonis]|uniref:TIGR02594 family protein n=1 Tax=Rhizobium ruizarguesonis TaxID=2081791 RepID=UPI00103213AD|nr:TIGR02594 family protein [Rhizobium ruizarguesonis]TBE77242.1 TIGR02594 family protein [Rhizobium ruizarguesonis]